MSIAMVYQDENVTVYCADRESIFRPAPAVALMLQPVEKADFILNTGKEGVTAFQVILAAVEDITVQRLSAEGVTCLATEGIDISGTPFCKNVSIKAGDPWPLWCLLDRPKGSSLNICIQLENGKEITFPIKLNVSDVYNSSLSNGGSLARLQWLNSSAGNESHITKGFCPVSLRNNTISILGRHLRISQKGFIESVETRFTGNNSSFSDTSRELLSSPIEYVITENGQALNFTPVSLSIIQKDATCCTWEAENICGTLRLIVRGSVDFDGTVQFHSELKYTQGRTLSVQLRCGLRSEFSKYFMGLGVPGCETPKQYRWIWDENKRQDSCWCGSVNGGIFIHPTGQGLQKPFVNIYFHHSRNYMPKNWVNNGNGYFSLSKQTDTTILFDSGDLLFNADSVFCSELMISPFKLVDIQEHWNTHYYHKNYNTPYTDEDVKDALAAGCTHINVHHGNDTVPLLNYPMHELDSLAEFADLVHRNGLGIKPYYTVRELTTRLPELFPFRSLGTEIFPLPAYEQGGVPFHNGVDPFLTENFGNEVIPAWKHTFVGGKYDGMTDPTVVTNPAGRICNFYVGSIAWLIENIGIDGLYIDDNGCDRNVMRRVRRVFDQYNPSAKIDFHTCNHFEDSPSIGFGFGHNMLIYMELLPYLDSLWVGEAYDYDTSSPEYLLTEVSGLPFGLMSEMLEGNCNVWRGMLFGMTSRYPYYKCYTGPSPVPIWDLRKEFSNGIMIGFWEDSQPVWSDHTQVLCTSYYDAERNRYLCCFASFADDDASFHICGKTANSKRIYAPYIEGIQPARSIAVRELITLPPKGGIMLIIETK